MKESVQIDWNEGMSFGASVDGYTIDLDAKEEHGGKGKGPRPKPLMMVSLAGCTGMDVVSLLNKMRIEFEALSIRIEGELTEEHPKHFTAMHLIYEFKGKDLPMDKLEKAVSLSQEKYCGVSATYKKAMNITYEIKIV
jgi:putative redox protein